MRLPSSLAVLVTLTASGCCGPCASWVTSGGTGTSPPPLATAPETPGQPAVRGALVSPSSASSVHPVFPARRVFPRPTVTLTSNGTWIPQLDDQARLFDTMPKDVRPGPSDGLVVCHVRVTGKFDDFRGPDVAAWLTAGERRFDFWGPEDTYDSYFSIPHATWKTGQTVTLVVEDRDVTGTEPIGTVTGPTGSMPVSFTHAQMNAECRAFPSEVVETKAKALSSRLAAELAKAQKSVRPQPGTPQWGYSTSGVPELWKSVDELAAHVGFEDPRVKALGVDLARLEKDWTSATTRSVATETARLPPLSKRTTLHLGDVDVTVASVLCDKVKVAELAPGSKWLSLLDPASLPPCYAKLSVTRTAPADRVFVMPSTYVAAEFVLADGSEVSAQELALLDSQGHKPDEFQWTPKPGETYSVILVPANAASIGEGDPAEPLTKLLRFTRGGGKTSPLARLDD